MMRAHENVESHVHSSTNFLENATIKARDRRSEVRDVKALSPEERQEWETEQDALIFSVDVTTASVEIWQWLMDTLDYHIEKDEDRLKETGQWERDARREPH
jgi:hypothetical protein